MEYGQHFERPEGQPEPAIEDLIAEAERRPDKYVRKSAFVHFGESSPEPAEALAVRDEELVRLRQLGVDVPQPEVLGIRSAGVGNEVVEVADRVMGTELDLAILDHADGLDARQLNDYYAALLQHLKDARERGGFYMSDLTRENRQAMFGHIATDLQDKIRLVDVGPNIENYHRDEPHHPDNEFFERSARLLPWTIKFARDRGYEVGDIFAQAQAFYEEVRQR